MARITRKQAEERVQFVVSRIRSGLSRVEIIRQIAAEYNTGETQSKEWYIKGADSLIVIDPHQRPRVRAGLIELLHAQLIGYQQDLSVIATDIKKVDDWLVQRTMLQEQLLAANLDVAREKRLQLELSFIPRLQHNAKTLLITHKVGVRDRIVKICTELARLHGLYVEEMPWLRAVQVLVENNLLPAETADNLLALLQDFTSRVEAIPSVTDAELEIQD
jgi:hypothetical protein